MRDLCLMFSLFPGLPMWWPPRNMRKENQKWKVHVKFPECRAMNSQSLGWNWYEQLQGCQRAHGSDQAAACKARGNKLMTGGSGFEHRDPGSRCRSGPTIMTLENYDHVGITCAPMCLVLCIGCVSGPALLFLDQHVTKSEW